MDCAFSYWRLFFKPARNISCSLWGSNIGTCFCNRPNKRFVYPHLFIRIVIGGSLILYTWRSSLLQQSNPFSLLSRETGLLINNILLVTAMLSVLLGTLYPLILDTLNLGKISVGAPYFNAVFVPIMIPGVIALAVFPYMRWKKDSLSRVFNLLKFEWICVVLLTFLSWVFITDNIFVLVAVGSIHMGR